MSTRLKLDVPNRRRSVAPSSHSAKVTCLPGVAAHGLFTDSILQQTEPDLLILNHMS